MTYAVMQTKSEPPSTEQLTKAFQQVPGLTALDASVLGRDACGVLVKGFELERASTMQTALAAQGVETEVVEEPVLTELPPARQLSKVEFTPEALRIEDFLGRSFLLEWNTLLVIAAGRARLTEFKTNLVDKVVTTPARDYMPKVVVKAVTTEEQNDHLLLEIMTRGVALRYHAMADQLEARLLFQCLGEQRGNDPAANLTLFVRELARFAPEAIYNRGAAAMREESNPPFLYLTRTAFYREITWLLWMVSSGRLR
jgi:hypothetical protein